MGAAIPMNAGHQMDLHHLYEMVVELSDVLKNNRDVTKNIVANAEEIVVCGPTCIRVAQIGYIANTHLEERYCR